MKESNTSLSTKRLDRPRLIDREICQAKYCQKFRSRYSLLTLLVLTALVVGGVKLWYGPHRVVMTYPKIDDLKEITRTDLSMYAPPAFGETFSYHYQNTLGGKELLTLQCNYASPLPHVVQIDLYGEVGHILVFPSENSVESNHVKETHEVAICWISGKLDHVPPGRFDGPPSYVPVGSGYRLHYGPAYLITNQKQIYLTKLLDLKPSSCELIELDAIKDVSMRVQIQKTLASIPDLK